MSYLGHYTKNTLRARTRFVLFINLSLAPTTVPSMVDHQNLSCEWINQYAFAVCWATQCQVPKRTEGPLSGLQTTILGVLGLICLKVELTSNEGATNAKSSPQAWDGPGVAAESLKSLAFSLSWQQIATCINEPHKYQFLCVPGSEKVAFNLAQAESAGESRQVAWFGAEVSFLPLQLLPHSHFQSED